MTHEIPQEQNGDRDLKTSIKEKTIERIDWIKELVAELGGEDKPLEEVLPEPTAVRDEAPMPNWTPEQEAKAREIGHRFGYGAEQDVPSGLSGGVAIAEGGKVWKIMAEAEAIKSAETPERIVFAGSPYRKLGQDELTFLQEKHSATFEAGVTEYDIARWVAERHSNTVLEEPAALAFGYEIAEGNPVTTEATGQLVRVGETINGQSVELLRIDREPYVDESGESKFRHQPNSGRVMEMVSEVLAQSGDETSPLSFVTSNTYASKQVNEIRAGLKHGRQFGVALYGRQTIINLGAPVPAETPLNHLPGDLRAMHDNLQQLLAEIVKAEADHSASK